MVTGNPETVPSWPAGHKVVDTETSQVLKLLQGTGPSGGLWAEQTFYRSADQVFQSSTTLTNDNVFVVPVLANASYVFDGWFIYSSNATALFKCGWTLPASASGFWTTQAYPSTIVASPGTIDAQIAALTTTKTLGLAAANTTAFAPMGNIIIGATAGNVVFQFAQSVSTAVNTGMRAGAWLRVRRVL